jgi:transposase
MGRREKLLTLSRKERDAGERRYQQTRDHRGAARLQCLRLLHDGDNRKQVAQMLRAREKTVKRWVKRVVPWGVEPLATFPYDQSGVHCELSAEQQAQGESPLPAR